MSQTAVLQQLLDGNETLQTQGPDWLRALRATAADQVTVTGLPTPKWEDWKYSSLRVLEKTAFSGGEKSEISEENLPDRLEKDSIRVVFVNGRYENGLSDRETGEIFENFAEISQNSPEILKKYLVSLGDFHEKPFLALNTAQMVDGAVLRVPDGKIIRKPVELVFYNTGTAAFHPRHLIVLGKNAELTLLEQHVGTQGEAGATLANHMAEIWLEEGAKLRHFRLQKENINSFHIYNNRITCEKASDYNGFTLTIGAKFSRYESYANLLSEQICCRIRGSYGVRADQHCDTAIVVNHLEPRCQSQQYFKGVAGNEARAVYQGRSYVSHRASQTVANQSHHALLLSESAEVDCKPELTIDTDDVSCSHGATTGQIDPAALFYLKSRGIPEARARALLVQSFLSEAIDQVEHESVRTAFHAEMAAWLEAYHG